MIEPAVMWHDVECGTYEADLALWQALAREAGGPVLDVGAGTGRVALRLAEDGVAVTALDLDPRLLAALDQRAVAAGLTVETVVADAAAPGLDGRGFALIAVPMQTIQLLPGAAARGGFFAGARAALAPGGVVALAIADGMETFDEHAPLPLPDVGEDAGRRYVSQPLAIREVPGGVRIERVRTLVAADGTRASEDDAVVLQAVTAETLAAEAAPHGLRAEPSRWVEATEEHVGSEVVVLRG